MNEQPKQSVFFGGCPHDCPDTCSMLFEVQDGKLTSVRGNPDHPMTRGGLCVKLKDYENRHYHPDRLLHPLRRTGPKGSKQFKITISHVFLPGEKYITNFTNYSLIIIK